MNGVGVLLARRTGRAIGCVERTDLDRVARILDVNQAQPAPRRPKCLVSNERELAIVSERDRVCIAFGGLRLGKPTEPAWHVGLGHVEHDHAQVPVRQVGGASVWTEGHAV